MIGKIVDDITGSINEINLCTFTVFSVVIFCTGTVVGEGSINTRSTILTSTRNKLPLPEIISSCDQGIYLNRQVSLFLIKFSRGEPK